MSEKVEENSGVNCLYDKIIIKIEKDLEAPTVTMETNDNNVNFVETVHIKTEPETVTNPYDVQPCMFVRNISDQIVDNCNDIKIQNVGHIKVEKNDGFVDEGSVGGLESGDHDDQYQNGIPADIETLQSSYLNEMISEESRNEKRRHTKPKKFHEETMDSDDENEDQADPDSDWTPDSEQNIEMSTPMLCRYCGNFFKSKSTLRQHELRHKAEGPYKCRECKMVAFSSSNFERHLRSHTTAKPFNCEKCGKSFKGEKDLKRHQNRENSNKKYSCDHCDNIFEEKSQLRDHVGIHTGNKEHRCKICNKCFRFRSNLNRHVNTHSTPNRYNCRICQAEFTRRDNLKQHQRTHTAVNTSVKCVLCTKEFKIDRYLKEHIKRKHT